jgi:hypothetical protein
MARDHTVTSKVMVTRIQEARNGEAVKATRVTETRTGIQIKWVEIPMEKNTATASQGGAIILMALMDSSSQATTMVAVLVTWKVDLIPTETVAVKVLADTAAHMASRIRMNQAIATANRIAQEADMVIAHPATQNGMMTVINT